MMARKTPTRDKTEPLTTLEVGRYLKRLSAMNKDPQTGNLALSAALQELAMFLIDSKEHSVRKIFAPLSKQTALDVDQRPVKSYVALSLLEVSELLSSTKITRTELVRLGFDRFGISGSKTIKLSKEAILSTIRSAMEHEQSIEILSDEAKRGGRSRRS